MWMCETCIVIDPNNADGNSLADLVAALRLAGASVEQVDEERQVVYALVSAVDLATIRMMEGVAYVRVSCHYHADRGPQAEAQALATAS